MMRTLTDTVVNVSGIYVPTLIILFVCGGQFYNFINEIWLEMSGKCWKLLWTAKNVDGQKDGHIYQPKKHDFFSKF